MFQHSVTLTGKKFLRILVRNFLCSSLWPFPLILSKHLRTKEDTKPPPRPGPNRALRPHPTARWEAAHKGSPHNSTLYHPPHGQAWGPRTPAALGKRNYSSPGDGPGRHTGRGTRPGRVYTARPRQGRAVGARPAGCLTHGGLAGLAEGVVGEALHQAGLAHSPRADDDDLQLEVGGPRRLLPAAGLPPGQRRRPPRRARPELQPAAPRPALRQPRARLHQRRMRRRAGAELPARLRRTPRRCPARRRRPPPRGSGRRGPRGRGAAATRPGPTGTATGTGTQPTSAAATSGAPGPGLAAQRPLQHRSRGPAPQCRGRAVPVLRPAGRPGMRAWRGSRTRNRSGASSPPFLRESRLCRVVGSQSS